MKREETVFMRKKLQIEEENLIDLKKEPEIVTSKV